MARVANSTPKRTRLRLLEVAPRGTLGSGHETSLGSGGDVPLDILVPSTQTVDAFDINTAAGATLFGVDKSGNVKQSGVTAVVQCVAQVTLTAAQITTLHSVPVGILAAPGAGVAIMLDAMVFQFKFGTVQFTGGSGVSAVYHGATGTNLLGGSVAAATITAAANATISAGAPASALALTTNTGVDLYSGVDFAAGDSTAIVTVWYSLITLG